MLVKNNHIPSSPHSVKRKTGKSTFFPGKDIAFFQPKPTVGPVDDVYEQEANAVAEKVMHIPSSNQAFFSPIPFVSTFLISRKCAACEEEEKVQRKEEDQAAENSNDVRVSTDFPSDVGSSGNEESILQTRNNHSLYFFSPRTSINSFLQRKEDEKESAPSEVPSIVQEVLNSTGSPLNKDTRTFMETRFGYDFRNVKIHTNSVASKSAKSINALAFTNGNNIVFNEGHYAPSTDSGKRLLAHELTHVIQQGSSKEAVQRAPGSEPEMASEDFIPTATYSINLSGIIFTVPPEATFQPGKKMPQLIRIVLKTLLVDQYDESLVEPVTRVLVAKGFKRAGHFASSKDAYKGELIDPFFLEIGPFLTIQRELEKRDLSVRLSDEDRENLEESLFGSRLWADFNKMANEEGMPLPPWYSKAFFDFQIQQDSYLLKNYMFFGKEFLKNKDELSQGDLLKSVEEVLFTLYTPIAILDAIRKDTILSINPETQLVYLSMWKMPGKDKRNKVPAYIHSIDTVIEFLNFAVKQDELFRDAETLSEARAKLLKKFQGEGNFKPDKLTVLPPFPSFIVAPDLNTDNTTITSARNYFRMIVNFGASHGSGIHGVSVAMGMDMYFSWKVFPMPGSLKAMKAEPGITPSSLVEAVDDFVKTSPANMGEPKNSYGPDESYERSIAMKNLGVGDFVLMGQASPTYRADLNWVQQPSTAGYPFFVFDAADLARMSTYADWDTLQSLKEQAKQADPERRKELEIEIKQLETRETTDLLSLTSQDIEESKKLLDSAVNLKAFIEEDQKKKLSREGNKSTDPFILRLKKKNIHLYNVFKLVGKIYDLRVHGDKKAVEKFIDAINQQIKDLTNLQKRTEGAYGSFKSIDDKTPSFRALAALVKEDDGNLVPLLMVAGYHPEADPKRGIHKIKLVDVTFAAPDKQKMIYVGEPVLDMSVADELPDKELLDWKMKGAREATSEEEAKGKAIDYAMVKFGADNKYGNGKILYRIPGTSYSGEADSVTTAYEYLQMAIAALGLVVLIAGVVASFGALTPAAAAVVIALGISVAVVGALMSAHNIGERKEKGTLKMDAEMALDIVNIIGAVVIGVGQIAKITITASRMSQISKLMQLTRLEKSLLLYDAVDFSANVFLINAKVKEDIDAIKQLDLPDHIKNDMIAAVTFEAIQQGAIMAVSAGGIGKQAVDYHRTKVETSTYKSWSDRGWIEVDVDGKTRVTENAPPFLRESELTQKTTLPDQGDQGQAARVQVEQEMMATVKTLDGEHSVTLTERGRIIRCSDACQDLRVKYEKELLRDPELQQRLVEIETKAQEAAKTKNEKLKEATLAEAKELEGDLASVVRRESVKSYKDIKVQTRWKGMRDYRRLLTKLEASNVSPGYVQDIFDNAVKNGEKENFVASLYLAVLEHEKSPMSNFKKLIEGLAYKNEELYRTARSLAERMSIVRTNQRGVKQVDNILSRFSMQDLSIIRKNHSSGAKSDVEVINALDSIIAKTDESSGKIVHLIAKAAAPSNPDKPDLLRLENILNNMPAGKKYKAVAIEEAIVRSNEFAANIKEALADPVHGFEKIAKEIWGESAVDGKKIAVEERFREGVAGAGEAAYSQIIKVDDRGDSLASGIVLGDKIDMARWEVVKKVVNKSNIATGIKNNVIGELWSRINKLKLEAQRYTVFREVFITDGTTVAKADLVAVKDGEIRIIECKAMAGELSDKQKKIYPYLESGEFDKVKIVGNPSLNATFKDAEVLKSYELLRDTTP